MNEEPKWRRSPQQQRQPDPKPLPKPEWTLLAIAVARAFKAADNAATPLTISELTLMTDHHWSMPPDIVMGESSSSALDLNDPHWTETQQQQLLHEMRIPPQPHTMPEETTPVEEIKNRLWQIDDIHNNMPCDREMQRQRILSIATTGTPITMTSSLERDSDMG
jgi:hypothetical protein